MKIQTNYDVHNLVCHKFGHNVNGMVAFEIMEVNAQVCYGGTQVFYLVKPIILSKVFKDKWKDDGDFSWDVGIGRSKDDNGTGWQRLREDELIDCPQNFVDIILNKS